MLYNIANFPLALAISKMEGLKRINLKRIHKEKGVKSVETKEIVAEPLIYADDLLMIVEKVESAGSVNKILKDFKEISGLKSSDDKMTAAKIGQDISQ